MEHKKEFYKQWWFWGIAVTAVIAIAVAYFAGKSSDNQTPSAVNSDIPSWGWNPTTTTPTATQQQTASQLVVSATYAANEYPGPQMTPAQEADYTTYLVNNLSTGDVSSADCTNLENNYQYPFDSIFFGQPPGIQQGDGIYIYAKHRCLGYLATYHELGGPYQLHKFYAEQIIDLATNSGIVNCAFEQYEPAAPSVTYKRLAPDTGAEDASLNGTTINCGDSSGYNWHQINASQTPLFLIWNKLQSLNGY